MQVPEAFSSMLSPLIPCSKPYAGTLQLSCVCKLQAGICTHDKYITVSSIVKAIAMVYAASSRGDLFLVPSSLAGRTENLYPAHRQGAPMLQIQSMHSPNPDRHLRSLSVSPLHLRLESRVMIALMSRVMIPLNWPNVGPYCILTADTQFDGAACVMFNTLFWQAQAQTYSYPKLDFDSKKHRTAWCAQCSCTQHHFDAGCERLRASHITKQPCVHPQRVSCDPSTRVS